MTPTPLTTVGQQNCGSPRPLATASSFTPSHIPVGTAEPPLSMDPRLTQLTRTYLGSTAWGSLTLQKPYITF